ncbi:hypothetical protein ACHAXR_002356 [Thalassiosira sp. AJA248-18]
MRWMRCRFTIEHGLSCKKGGLLVQMHGDARDEAGELAAMALTRSHVSYEPLIFYDRGVTATQQPEAEAVAIEREVRVSRDNTAGEEARGDISVHGLWKKSSTCILDMRITDTDSMSYESSTSSEVSEKAAKNKKENYLDACIERRRSFTLLVYSVDGMACSEAKAFKKRIASFLSGEHGRPYSEMVGFVRQRISLAVIR